MARIDFEASVYGDPRFLSLLLKVGNVYTAKGMLVTAWELAQKYWLDHRSVPANVWPEDLQPLLDVGLAQLELAADRTSWVYVSGSESKNKWLEGKQKGGQSTSVKKSESSRRNLESTTKISQQNPNSNPTDHEHSLSSSSFSVPVSSPKENYIGHSGVTDPDFREADQLIDQAVEKIPKIPKPKKTQFEKFAQTNPEFAGELERIYRDTFPRKIKKSLGMEYLAESIRSAEDVKSFEDAVVKYRAQCERNQTAEKYIMHFSTFCHQWRDWADPTGGQSENFQTVGRILTKDEMDKKIASMGNSP